MGSRTEIVLVAEGDGSAYFLRRNAALSPEQPIRAFVAAYAAWSANQLWHDSQEKPADEQPVEAPVLIEMV